jgi:hypothetical protein
MGKLRLKDFAKYATLILTFHFMRRDSSTFWATTGTYPQEFVIQLGAMCDVTKIKTLTTNGKQTCSQKPNDASYSPLFSVRSLVIERCEGSSPTTWEKVLEMGAYQLFFVGYWYCIMLFPFLQR